MLEFIFFVLEILILRNFLSWWANSTPNWTKFKFDFLQFFDLGEFGEFLTTAILANFWLRGQYLTSKFDFSGPKYSDSGGQFFFLPIFSIFFIFAIFVRPLLADFWYIFFASGAIFDIKIRLLGSGISYFIWSK